MCEAAIELCCKPCGFCFVLLQISGTLFRKMRNTVVNQWMESHYEIAGHEMASGGTRPLILKLGN